MVSALARLFKPLTRGAVALGLGLCLMLTACSGDPDARLTGNYADDTLSVAQTILVMIDIPQDDPSHAQAESEARSLITDYVSRYRAQPRINGLSSVSYTHLTLPTKRIV